MAGQLLERGRVDVDGGAACVTGRVDSIGLDEAELDFDLIVDEVQTEGDLLGDLELVQHGLGVELLEPAVRDARACQAVLVVQA